MMECTCRIGMYLEYKGDMTYFEDRTYSYWDFAVALGA